MKKYLYTLLTFIGFVAFSSCEEETFTTTFDTPEMNEEVEEGYANLEILMNTSDLNVSSRVVGPLENPTNNSSWTNWEKFCDGSLLYHVTLFLVKNGTENGIADGTLVAYRDFFYDSDDINEHNGFYENNAVNTTAATGVQVKATFSSKYPPVHGDIEKLQKGNYRLIAVANYAPIDATKNKNLFASGETAVSYAGLGNVAEDGTNNKNGEGGSFTDIVSTVIGNFDQTTGLSEFTTTANSNGASLLNYKLNSGDDRVCKLLPQPLVMVRDITLKNGNNTLSGELYRTFARIRLDVTNADVEYPIGVSQLSFTGTYASKTAYLFNDRLGKGLYDCFATNDMGTLTVTSTDAIFPFMNRTNQILAGKSLTLLDCYILEGKTGTTGVNAFSFKTTYWTDPWSGSATTNIQITNWNTFLSYKVFIRESTSSTYNILKADETSGTIVIRNAGAGAQDKAATTLNPLFLWYIIPRGDLQINNQLGFAEGYLMNVGTGKYLQAHDGSTTDFSLKLGEYPSTLYFKINFNGTDEYGTIFCQSKDGNYYYINSESSVWSKYGTSAPSLNTGNYSFLTFETIPGEPVGAVTKDQGSTIDIDNNTSLETGSTENVIVRNDFFHYKFNCKVTNATEVSVKPVEHTRRIKLNDFSSNSDPYISVSGITTTTNGTSSYVNGIEYFYFDYYIDTDGYLVVTIKYLLESSDSKLPDNATINFGTVRSGGGGPNGGNVTENITHSILISNFINTMTDIVLEKAT